MLYHFSLPLNLMRSHLPCQHMGLHPGAESHPITWLPRRFDKVLDSMKHERLPLEFTLEIILVTLEYYNSVPILPMDYFRSTLIFHSFLPSLLGLKSAHSKYY